MQEFETLTQEIPNFMIQKVQIRLFQTQTELPHIIVNN